MKNSVIKIMTLIVLMTSAVSCKDILKEDNPSGLTAEAVFTTAPGYETLIAGAYSYQRWWYGKEEGMGASEMGTDLWTAGSESFIATSGLVGENKPVILYSGLNGSNLNLTSLWRQMYAAVNLCNRGIEIAEENGVFKPDPKKVAELRFLRAFYYWHIVETWGPVHFTTSSTKEPILTANKTSENVFYDLIISDLTTAADALDATSSYGRANKYVAKAFLARAYLYRAYRTNSTTDFEAARTLAKEVIASNRYTLMPNFKDLWSMSNEKNSEVIWSVNYSTDLTNTSDVYNDPKHLLGYGKDILTTGGNPTTNRGSNNTHAFFIPAYDRRYIPFDNILMLKRDVRNGWPFVRFKPTKHLLSLYDRTRDERYYGTWQTVWKVNGPVASGRLVGKTPYVDTALVIDFNPTPQPTKYYTLSWDTLYNANGSSKTFLTSTAAVGNQLFPALLKFQDSTRSAVGPNEQANGNIQSARDVVVIRLAEMHLIAAEAAFQLGDLSDASDQVNFLRTRAALPGALPTFLTSAGDITLDFILDERAREMAGEYQRWFDLKRTGRLFARVTANNPDVATGLQSHHILRPIPQQQLDAVTNKGEFAQNLGY
jgi:starch-binding outer membrane protein, SusD/RagB family